MTKIKKVHCNRCGVETKHELKHFHENEEVEEEMIHGQRQVLWWEKSQYSYWICRGCDTPCLEENYTCAGMAEYGEQVYDSTFYPERLSNHKKPKSFAHIDEKLSDLYKEIIKAFNIGLGVPTAMAIRSLLEGICIDQDITDSEVWKFEKKIEKLQEVAGIHANIIEGLKSLKFIGDDAAHRLISPPKRVMILAIELLEALLTQVYEAKFELQKKAEEIKIADQR